jgi:hypothetical protein
MHRRVMMLLVIALLTMAPMLTSGQDRPSVRIPRVSTAPTLESVLQPGVVPPGAHITDFKQRNPGDGVEASVQTDAYLSYDDKHLYAVVVCKDDPVKVRANLAKRESIMDDDIVAIVLDTYGDGRRSYMFVVNPRGIQTDAIVADGQEDDYSYDTVWASEGRLTKDGYAVVLSVPFKSLRFSTARVQTWGIAVGRQIPRLNETSFWPYITNRISGFGRQLARLEGLEGISPGRNLQAIPYGNFASDRVLGDEGYVSDRSARVGIDAKAVIKDAVTVDATVNPDFSQVESDEPQVTINQRFEVFFEEKRPFFIENSGYFQTPQTLFFSRRVADPRFGMRVTGKANGWSFGSLLTTDDAPGTRIDADDPRHDKAAGVLVLRAQREFAGQSSVGAIVTDREWGDAASRVVGLDGRWKINDNWTAMGQAVRSQAVSVDGDESIGGLATAQLNRQSRGLNVSVSYLQVSPAFRTDLGYVTRRDIRSANGEVEYAWHPEKRRLLSYRAGLESEAIWDFSGEMQEWSVEPSAEAEFPGNTLLELRHWNVFERYENREFRRHSTMIGVETSWLSWLGFEGTLESGTAVNYYPAAGLVPILGNSLKSEFGVTLKPASRLRVDQSYLYTRLTTRSGDQGCACASSEDIFSNHILRTRANYQFTRELSLRAILDYGAVLPDQRLIDLEKQKNLGLDVLVTYLVNPWTAVYVGYTDTYENWRLGSPIQRPVDRSNAATTSTGRQVFVKISYLLRY